MEGILAVLLVIVIYIALPALVGFAIAGFVLLQQHRIRVKLGNAELMCAIDADCPPDYVCVGGRCVPEFEAKHAVPATT